MQRVLVTIEGGSWSDFQEMELPRLPDEGELIETKYGTCIVERSESADKNERYSGKVVCRLR